MTLFDIIGLMARGGSFALLALWSWMLLRDYRDILAAKLAVAMNAAIICYLLVTIEWSDLMTAPLPRGMMLFSLLLALGAGATPGLFWLFAKTWFNDERELRIRDLALLLIAIVNTLIMQLSFPLGGRVNAVSGVLFRLSMLGFAAAALRAVWRGREGDLVEGRRRLRTRMILVVGLYVIVIALTEIAVHNGWIQHRDQHVVGSFAVVVIFAFCAVMFGMQQAELFGSPVVQPKRPALPAFEGDPLIEKLRAHMAAEMPHRDETLSIAKLAAQLGEQEYRLRRVINGQMGHRNFASFLNGYRLAEVKAALADAGQKEVPIITIALDAGFGSLGPFNRAFRETEGMTPSEYRASAIG